MGTLVSEFIGNSVGEWKCASVSNMRQKCIRNKGSRILSLLNVGGGDWTRPGGHTMKKKKVGCKVCLFSDHAWACYCEHGVIADS